jgi:O-antigen/teichoic acid export membrane protein
MDWLQQIRSRFGGHIVRNVLSLFSGTLVAHIAVMINFVILARQLGLVQYGQYAASTTLVSALSIGFSLGLDTWVLREGGRDLIQLPAYLGSVSVLKIAFGSMWFLAIQALAPWLDAGTFPLNLVRLAAIVFWLDSLLLTALSGFKAALQNQRTAMLEVGSDLLTLLATLVLATLKTIDVSTYLWGRIVALLISLAVAGWCVAIYLGVPLPQSIKGIAPHWRTIMSFAISDLLAWATMRLDVLIVALTLGSKAVGLYSLAVTVVNSLFILPGVGYTVMIPALSHVFAIDAPRAWTMSWRSVAGQAFIGFVLAVGLLGAAPIAHWLLGHEYVPITTLLQLLSPLLFFKAISYGLAAILVALGRQGRRVLVQFLNVLLIVALDLTVVYTWGVSGVACVFVVTEVFICLGYGVLVYSAGGRFLAFPLGKCGG